MGNSILFTTRFPRCSLNASLSISSRCLSPLPQQCPKGTLDTILGLPGLRLRTKAAPIPHMLCHHPCVSVDYRILMAAFVACCTCVRIKRYWLPRSPAKTCFEALFQFPPRNFTHVNIHITYLQRIHTYKYMHTHKCLCMRVCWIRMCFACLQPPNDSLVE